MRKILTISLVLLIGVPGVVATTVYARPVERELIKVCEPADLVTPPASPAPTGVVFRTNQVSADTFYYGGTVIGAGGVAYAAEPSGPGWGNRKMWTWSATGFNGTPHSGLNMDGWVGVDNSIYVGQKENYFRVEDNATMGANCVIAGNRSLFCGVTNQESKNLCYVDQNGTGYGNNWHQTVVTKSYIYNAGDQITLSYQYHNDTEPGYDYTYVILQYYNSANLTWVDHGTMVQYTDIATGTQIIDVDSYTGGLTPPVTFRIKYAFASEGGYSDEDGHFTTTCGGFLLDTYSLAWSGGPTESEDFESVPIDSLPSGWQRIAGGVGGFARAEHLNNLPIGLNEDPCVLAVPGLCEIADSVIVLYDLDPLYPQYPHPPEQNNCVVSPIIDLSNHPAMGGELLQFDRFGNLSLNGCLFFYWQVRYAPGCASGGWSPWLTNSYVYYTPEGTSCATFSFDVSSYIPTSADQIQMAMGVLNLLSEDPDACWSPSNNATPYFDNATFVVLGSGETPFISMREMDYWQDQFAEDGTLNPTSTADTRTPIYLSDLLPRIYGDTLVCRGVADNAEVYFVFRMAKVGPRQPLTNDFFTTWFPEVQLGGWREARMDTSEVTSAPGTSTVLVPGWWMSAFHEADPVRVANALPEGTEVLPNNLFVPGTRIEYFLKARYVSSGDWFLLPDTAGGKYEEFEILPMMRDDGHGGLEWPCLIVADHFGQRGNWFERNSDRIGRHLTANGYDYDMYNKLGPTSGLMNGIGRSAPNPGQLGGPGTPKYNWGSGATVAQFLAYKYCMLNAGSQYVYSIDQSDADMIKRWLTLYTSPTGISRFFWLSGDQLVRCLNSSSYSPVWGPSFLNTILCATYVNPNYASQNSDYTYCLPMNGVSGGRIECGAPESYIVRSNGCPRGRVLSVIGVSTAAGCGGAAEIEYDSKPTKRYAAVTNVVNVPGGASYKTFVEGYDNCLIRTSASEGPLACGPDSFMTAWFACVLGWGGYGSSEICNPQVVSVGPNASALPANTSSLSAAYPNPMNPGARIEYSITTTGRVMLRVFDVSGRVIRTLLDETKNAGRYVVTWDGTNDRGEKLASGVFFYRLETPGFTSAKKLVILK